MLGFAYIVNMVSQFLHDLRVRHLQVVEYVLKFLKVTLGRWILFKIGGGLIMEAYIYVDYAAVVSDRISTSICYTFLYGNLVFF